MITLNFTTEFEILLIKAYAQANRRVSIQSGVSTNFLGAAQQRSGFVKEYMKIFGENCQLLDSEVRKGGHANSSEIMGKVSTLVESKLNSALFHKDNRLDEASFRQVVRDLKKDVRTVFYDGYLSSR